MNVRPAKQRTKPTPADTLLLRALSYKAAYFTRQRLLANDGSFYYDDARLAFENCITIKTVMRSKRRLRAMGRIKFEPGRHKGNSTKYWILIKDDLMSSLPKPDCLTAKHDLQSRKAGQHVIPNKLINKKKDSFQKEEMTDAQEKERHDAFQEFIRGLKRKHGFGTKTGV